MKTSDVSINMGLRPCIVNEKKMLFHAWEHYAQVISPGFTIGSTPGGQVSSLFGIVEDEQGNIIRVDPTCIKFIDNKIREYSFK